VDVDQRSRAGGSEALEESGPVGELPPPEPVPARGEARRRRRPRRNPVAEALAGEE
jgi:hypothetical protein